MGFRLFVFFFSFTLKVILHFEAITESTVHYKRMVSYTDGVKQFSSAMVGMISLGSEQPLFN